MNPAQLQYDADVQKYNRDSTIRDIENKLDILKQMKAVIYAEGQRDKIENGRRTTLSEYHRKLDDCDAKIDQHMTFIEKMKVMNGYVPRKVSMANPPTLGTRVRSKSASRTRRYPTPRYPLDPEQLKRTAKAILGSKMSDASETYSWIVESPFLNKLEKIKESADENASIPEEEELDKEIEETQKDLDRARCCFGL